MYIRLVCAFEAMGCYHLKSGRSPMLLDGVNPLNYSAFSVFSC
jgi:hypothetical protein